MTYHEKEYKQRLSLAQRHNALIVLISMNLILFVILAFIKAVYFMQYEDNATAASLYHTRILSLFTLPADLSTLASRPWTIGTYMFTHETVWHLLGNMLWLWVFGYILQDLTGNRKIFPVFIYGALAGGLAFILAYNFFPALRPELPYQSMLGASAGAMAIAAAVTTLAPGYRIFPMLNGGIPVWVLTVIYLIIDLATISKRDNTGGHISHLAGALTGFLFIVSFRRGYDWGGWMNGLYEWFNNLFNPDRPKKGREIKKELFYKSDKKPFNRKPNVTQQRIDEILDKISQHGYESLSDEEKELLRKAAKDS
jgi:membrane associated rhomboid family serine protease